MIPLLKAVKMSFNSVRWDRKQEKGYSKKVRQERIDNPVLFPLEESKVLKFIRANCNGLTLSSQEVKHLFASYQKSKSTQRKRSQIEQLSLYPAGQPTVDNQAFQGR